MIDPNETMTEWMRRHRGDSEVRRRLVVLVAACLVVAALVGLVACGPADSTIEAGVPVSGEVEPIEDPGRFEEIEPVMTAPTDPPTTTTTAPPETTTTAPPPTTAATVTTAPPAPPTTDTAPPPPAPEPSFQSAAADGCGGWGSVIEAHFPGDEATACRVMLCESEGDRYAVNGSSGASGLFQVMPAWASRYRQVTGLPYYDGRFDANANTAFAAYLVRHEGWASQFDCY